MIGTEYTDGATETRMVVSGNTRGTAGNVLNGNILHIAAPTIGSRAFYTFDNKIIQEECE